MSRDKDYANSAQRLVILNQAEELVDVVTRDGLTLADQAPSPDNVQAQNSAPGNTRDSITTHDQSSEDFSIPFPEIASESIGLEELRIVQQNQRLLDRLSANVESVNNLIDFAKDNFVVAELPDKLDIKKNIKVLYSLKFILDIVISHIKGDVYTFPSEREMIDLVTTYGIDSDYNNFENTLTRGYLIHLPRIVNLYLSLEVRDPQLSANEKVRAIDLVCNILAKEGEVKDGREVPVMVRDAQMVINFLVFLNRVPTNKFTSYKKSNNPRNYCFSPYGADVQFTNRPKDYGQNVGDDSRGLLDEAWMTNNSSNMIHGIAYLFGDVLLSENVSYLGQPVTRDMVIRNPGDPFLMKIQHDVAITKNGQDTLSLVDLEGIVMTNPAAKNNLFVKSGFEMEIGLDDEGDLSNEQQMSYNELKEDVFEALSQDAIDNRNVKPMSPREWASLKSKFDQLSRREHVMLHLILCAPEGKNLTFMDMRRYSMAGDIIRHLQDGTFDSAITDVIYAYEINIDEPCCLSESVGTARAIEGLIKNNYAPNYGIAIVQSPSFQLNFSVWVKDAQGRELNTAAPAIGYEQNPDGSAEAISVRYTVFFTKLIEEISKELTTLITKEFSAIFRRTDLEPAIDWGVYSIDDVISTSLGLDDLGSVSSASSVRRQKTGRASSIRIVKGEDDGLEGSRAEIRLIRSNVHGQRLMSNNPRYHEGIVNESESLEILAKKILVAIDTVNQKEVYNPRDKSSACSWNDNAFKHGRARGASNLSLDEDSVQSFLGFPRVGDAQRPMGSGSSVISDLSDGLSNSSPCWGSGIDTSPYINSPYSRGPGRS